MTFFFFSVVLSHSVNKNETRAKRYYLPILFVYIYIQVTILLI